jgi:hypothetical protein
MWLVVGSQPIFLVPTIINDSGHPGVLSIVATIWPRTTPKICLAYESRSNFAHSYQIYLILANEGH